MSDTPETDAMRKLTWKSSQPPVNPIPGEFAKKLERERDQAREAMETCRRVSRKDCEQNAKRAEELHVQKLTLERERDEAQYKLEDARQSLEVALEDLSEAKRERDEAREKIERQAERIRKLEGATNHAGGLNK